MGRELRRWRRCANRNSLEDVNQMLNGHAEVFHQPKTSFSNLMSNPMIKAAISAQITGSHSGATKAPIFSRDAVNIMSAVMASWRDRQNTFLI